MTRSEEIASANIPAAKVMVVDPGKQVASLIEKTFRDVVTISRINTGDTALQTLALEKFDIIVTQLALPVLSGYDLIAKLRKVRPDIPVITIATGSSRYNSDEILKLGYPLPVTSSMGEEEIIRRVRDYITAVNWRYRIDSIRKEYKRVYGIDNIISCDPAMRLVLEKITRVINNRVPVLINGGSGTGKELIARMISSTGNRSKKPFISVNCAAVPEGLLESQFFGHEKGSFTGATARMAGKFEQANGGTLFLDEIGEMSPALQAKLLRVLEYGEFERVGGLETIRVDVRLITATHRNLEQMVQEGKFRTDLFYRINVFPLFLPPLSQREDDIPMLAFHFAFQASMKNGRQVWAIDPEAISILKHYPWPGNIRELENTIERALLLSDGVSLKAVDFPQQLEWSEAHPDEDVVATIMKLDIDSIRPLAQVEKEAIQKALDFSNGNIALAARCLGIGRNTLYRKIEEHGLDILDKS